MRLQLRFAAAIPVFLAFWLNARQAQATHVMAANITYECLGGNLYRIRLSAYRDCGGISLGTTASISISSVSCDTSFSVVLNVLPPPPGPRGRAVTPVCNTVQSRCENSNSSLPGAEEFIYEGVVTLKPCLDWVISWNLCCRNNVINTINNPGNAAMTVFTTLNNLDFPCNNSPQFLNNPVPYICINSPINIINTAVDPDGDSLDYELLTPLSDPGTTVSYRSPYSFNSPLASNPPFSLNTQNGVMSMNPTQVQTTVTAVRVREFRNGQLVGSVIRDLQIVVINCNNQLPRISDFSGVFGGNNLTLRTCPGRPVSATLTTTDPNASDIVDLTFNNPIPGSTLTITNQGNPNRPTATFNWTPTEDDLGQIFSFVLTARDNACPITGRLDQVFQVIVESDVRPNATVPSVCLNEPTVFTSNPTGGVPPYQFTWTAPGFNFSNSGTSSTTSFTFPAPGNYNWRVRIVDGNGCITIQDGVHNVRPLPPIFIAPNRVRLCTGGSILLSAQGNPPYTWQNGSTNQTFTFVAPPGFSGDTMITVSAVGPNGCPNTGISRITVAPPPPPAACNVLFVTPTGSPTAPGNKSQPTTLLNAIELSRCNNTQINVLEGTYLIDTSIQLTDNVILEGGWQIVAGDWVKTNTAQTIIRRTNTQLATNPSRLIAFDMNTVNGFRLQDLTIETEDLNVATAGNGASNYGIYLNNCAGYRIVRCRLAVGAGTPGVNGAPGAQGAAGLNGANASGTTGAAPTGPAGQGQGGGGGNGGSSGFNGGGDGSNGVGAGAGSGGDGGSGGALCLIVGGGGNGGNATGVGTPGAAATGLGPSGTFAGGFFVPGGPGPAGGQGGRGPGGGGGGGSGSNATGNPGGGGGAGGQGGEGGQGGQGGTGGGGSFGVFAWNNGPGGLIRQSLFNVAPGAPGGLGGPGGPGGPGGAGGNGAGGSCGRTGGRGGQGGQGGPGGPGGQGATGLSLRAFAQGGLLSVGATDTLYAFAEAPVQIGTSFCTDRTISFETPLGTPSWNFGAGSSPSTGNGSPATTTYTGQNTGRKTITLNGTQLIDFYGVPSTPAAATPTILVAPDSVCAGEPFEFFASSVLSSSDFRWTIRDAGGNQLDFISGPDRDSILNYVFANPGTYTLELVTLSDCCGLMPAVTRQVRVTPTPTAVINGRTPICAGESVTLVGSGGPFRFWSDGTVADSIRVTPAVTTTYGLQVRAFSGCVSDTVFFTVVVNPLPVVTVTPPDTNICRNGNANFVFSGANVYRVRRVGDANYSVIPGNTFSILSTSADAYDVIGSDGNCDSEPVRFFLSLRAGGVPIILATDTNLCLGDSTWLRAIGGDIYFWSLTNQITSTFSNADSVYFQPSVPSSFYVYLWTEQAGCLNPVPDSILISVYPFPAIDIGPDTTACNDFTFRLPPNPNFLYSWNGSAIDTFPTYVVTSTGMVYLRITNLVTGCSATDSAFVTILGPPAVAIVNNDSTFCPGGGLVLRATNNGYAEYIWRDANGNIVSRGPNADTLIVTTPGFYEVEAVDAGPTNCNSFDRITVLLDTLPTFSLGPINFCPDSVGRATGPAGMSSYTWRSLAGTVLATTRTFSSAFPGDFILEVVNGNGCTFQNTVTFVQVPRPVLSPVNVDACQRQPLRIRAEVTNGTTGGTFFWFADRAGDTVLQAGVSNVLVLDTNTTTRVYYVAYQQGCYSDTIQVTANRLATPTANFRTNPPVSSVQLPAAATVSFENLTTTLGTPTFTQFRWYWGDGDSLITLDPDSARHTYRNISSDTNNVVTLIAVNLASGCSDTFRLRLPIVVDQAIFIPNVFTPNGDNFNDLFVPTFNGFDRLEAVIFDRWGREVFNNGGSTTTFWNGKQNNSGIDCPEGVYFYILKFFRPVGDRVVREGNVTLLR